MCCAMNRPPLSQGCERARIHRTEMGTVLRSGLCHGVVSYFAAIAMIAISSQGAGPCVGGQTMARIICSP
jgi:hypothetical protein